APEAGVGVLAAEEGEARVGREPRDRDPVQVRLGSQVVALGEEEELSGDVDRSGATPLPRLLEGRRLTNRRLDPEIPRLCTIAGPRTRRGLGPDHDPGLGEGRALRVAGRRVAEAVDRPDRDVRGEEGDGEDAGGGAGPGEGRRE